MFLVRYLLIYLLLSSTILSTSRLVLEFMWAGTGVYVGWYRSLCRLVLPLKQTYFKQGMMRLLKGIGSAV